MFTNQKGIYPFILAILSVVEDNLDFQRVVAANPLFYDVFVEGNMSRVGTVVRSMYVHTDMTIGKTPARLIGQMMFDPAFIIQIIAQTGGDKEMGHGGKGNIWQWAGINPHADFNGQVRPVIDVSLTDLRKAIKGN